MRVLYHGGPRGLAGHLLPPSETGAPSTADFGAAAVCRRDRVYLTSDATAAMMFAVLAPSEEVSVYEVEPVGELEHDPDTNEPGLSFQVSRARIIREVPVTAEERAAIMAML